MDKVILTNNGKALLEKLDWLQSQARNIAGNGGNWFRYSIFSASPKQWGINREHSTDGKAWGEPEAIQLEAWAFAHDHDGGKPYR